MPSPKETERADNQEKRPFNLPIAPVQGADLSEWIDYWVQVRFLARLQTDRRMAKHAVKQIGKLSETIANPPVVVRGRGYPNGDRGTWEEASSNDY